MVDQQLSNDQLSHEIQIALLEGTLTDEQAVQLQLPLDVTTHIKIFSKKKLQHSYQYRKAGLHILNQKFNAITKRVGKEFPGLYTTPVSGGPSFWDFGPICQQVVFPLNHPDFKRFDVTDIKSRCTCLMLVGPEYSLLDKATYTRFGWDWKTNRYLLKWAIAEGRTDWMDEALAMIEEHSVVYDDCTVMTKPRKIARRGGVRVPVPQNSYQHRTTSASISSTSASDSSTSVLPAFINPHCRVIDIAVRFAQHSVLLWMVNNAERLPHTSFPLFFEGPSPETIVESLCGKYNPTPLNEDMWKLLNVIAPIDYITKRRVFDLLLETGDLKAFALWSSWNPLLSSTTWLCFARTPEVFAFVCALFDPAVVDSYLREHLCTILAFSILTHSTQGSNDRGKIKTNVRSPGLWKLLLDHAARLHVVIPPLDKLLGNRVVTFTQNTIMELMLLFDTRHEHMIVLRFGQMEAFRVWDRQFLIWCDNQWHQLGGQVDQEWYGERIRLFTTYLHSNSTDLTDWLNIIVRDAPITAIDMACTENLLVHTWSHGLESVALWLSTFIQQRTSALDGGLKPTGNLTKYRIINTTFERLQEAVKKMRLSDVSNMEQLFVSYAKLMEHGWWKDLSLTPMILEPILTSAYIKEFMQSLLPNKNNREIKTCDLFALQCYCLLFGSNGLQILPRINAKPILEAWWAKLERISHSSKVSPVVLQKCLSFLICDSDLICEPLWVIKKLEQGKLHVNKWSVHDGPHVIKLQQWLQAQKAQSMSSRIVQALVGDVTHNATMLSSLTANLPKWFDLRHLFGGVICNPRLEKWIRAHYKLVKRRHASFDIDQSDSEEEEDDEEEEEDDDSDYSSN